jgi:hypothetical protein
MIAVSGALTARSAFPAAAVAPRVTPHDRIGREVYVIARISAAARFAMPPTHCKVAASSPPSLILDRRGVFVSIGVTFVSEAGPRALQPIPIGRWNHSRHPVVRRARSGVALRLPDHAMSSDRSTRRWRSTLARSIAISCPIGSRYRPSRWPSGPLARRPLSTRPSLRPAAKHPADAHSTTEILIDQVIEVFAEARPVIHRRLPAKLARQASRSTTSRGRTGVSSPTGRVTVKLSPRSRARMLSPLGFEARVVPACLAEVLERA